MGRPRKYATDAERVAAHRARYAVGEFRVIPETMATLDAIAQHFDVPRTEVVNSLINFALTNRNWFAQGLWGKRLPFNAAPKSRGTGDGGKTE